jgi:nitrite reductase/ring-hydroxylating ferredoxin subunit
VSWHVVAKVGDVKRGDVVAARVEGTDVIVGLDGDRYFATQRKCVHRGGDLVEGIISRGHIICPQHGWRFSTETGKTPEPSELCLVTYAVRVVGENIEVELKEGSECPPSA